MSEKLKLILIKITHTVIWVFYNVVIFYLLYAVVKNKIDLLAWICVGLVCFEALILAVFRLKCPLTLVAEKYSDSRKDNFDIYLPNWLAKYNKAIYTSIFVISLIILGFRLLE
jgi:hypothetical protein